MAHITMATTVRLPMKIDEWAKKRSRTNGQTISGFLRVTLEALKHDEDQAKKITEMIVHGDCTGELELVSECDTSWTWKCRKCGHTATASKRRKNQKKGQHGEGI